MSAATPAASTPDATSPANASTTNADGQSSTPSAIDRLVLEYLRSRGHKAAEQALLETIEVSSPEEKDEKKQPDAAASASTTISSEELVKKLAIFSQKPNRPGENALNDTTNVLQELVTMGQPADVRNLISSIEAVGAEEILSLDPADKQEGFRELEAWADGSLDMYRVSWLFVSSSSHI